MPKQAPLVVLSEQEEQRLLQITRRHRSEQQVVLRARIVLVASQGSSNLQIARELDVCVETVRLWTRLLDRMLPVLGRLPNLQQNNSVRWQFLCVKPGPKQDARSVSGQAE